MKKRTFLSILPVLGGLNVFAADASADELRNHPDMAPEKCSAHDADQMWESRSKGIRSLVGNSESSVTTFCMVYAENLNKWIDLKHPDSKATRTHIENSFHEAMSFINFAVWGGRIHVMPRFPATVRWIIWSGFSMGFARSTTYGGKYSQEDIRSMLTMIFHAQAEAWQKFTENSKGIDECLGELSKSEKSLPMEGRNYFRAHLLKQIANCI